MQIITFLSKHSVDCIFVAFIDCILTYFIKKKVKTLPSNLNRVLPFIISLFIYLTYALIFNQESEIAIKNSMSAGGLATVIYALIGGFSNSTEQQLTTLFTTLLKNFVAKENIDGLLKNIMLSLYENDNDKLVTIRISDLIKSNLTENADSESIKFVCKLFVNEYNKIKQKTK